MIQANSCLPEKRTLSVRASALTAPPKGGACAKEGRLRSAQNLSPSGEVASRSDDGEGFLAKADSLKAYAPKQRYFG